jgi:hypothetical protein
MRSRCERTVRTLMISCSAIRRHTTLVGIAAVAGLVVAAAALGPLTVTSTTLVVLLAV